MKTLHVDTGREMRGGQWQALYLTERLENAILLAPSESPLRSQARCDVRPLTFPALARLARNADLVHVHDAHAHTLAALAGGAPLVVSRRVGFPVKTSLASRWKYRRAAMYLAVSRFAANRLKDAGVSEERIRVVCDGVPVPPPASPEPSRIVALASKSVEIPGIPIHYTSDLWQDLSTASVFLYVSELEGLGSAALAAMATGVPVVASAVGGLPEIVEHERTGLLVTDGNYAGALRRLLDDPAAAIEMGRMGRQRVQQHFSIQAMLDGTLRAYEEVISQC